jgi:hypothetical protein
MPRVMRWKIPCALKERGRFDWFAGVDGTVPVPLQGTDMVGGPTQGIGRRSSLSPGLESGSPLGTHAGSSTSTN